MTPRIFCVCGGRWQPECAQAAEFRTGRTTDRIRSSPCTEIWTPGATGARTGTCISCGWVETFTTPSGFEMRMRRMPG